MTQVEALQDINTRLQMKMSLNADAAIAEQSRLKARISWLEGTALPHARAQSHADGFQVGWHAALKRVAEGDSLDELLNACPKPVEEPTR